MSSITNIYTPDPTDPFVIGLQEFNVTLPSDTKSVWGGGKSIPHTEESKALLKSRWTDERKQTMVNYLHTPEVSKKIKKSVQHWYDNASPEQIKSKSEKGLANMNSYIECPHCGIKTNKGNIGRYHNDKCKKKPVDIHNNI